MLKPLAREFAPVTQWDSKAFKSFPMFFDVLVPHTTLHSAVNASLALVSDSK